MRQFNLFAAFAWSLFAIVIHEWDAGALAQVGGMMILAQIAFIHGGLILRS